MKKGNGLMTASLLILKNIALHKFETSSTHQTQPPPKQHGVSQAQRGTIDRYIWRNVLCHNPNGNVYKETQEWTQAEGSRGNKEVRSSEGKSHKTLSMRKGRLTHRWCQVLNRWTKAEGSRGLIKWGILMSWTPATQVRQKLFKPGKQSKTMWICEDFHIR